MSGYDGGVGACSIQRSGSDPVRTVLTGGTGAAIFFSNTESGLAGAVLDLSRGDDDLRIVLVDRAGQALLTLGPFPEEEVIALWRSIVAACGVTPMMRAWNGEMESLACQLGKLRLGPVQDRRRLAVLHRRRPRFLTRRKSARLPPRPLVFREREIAGGREV